MSYVDIVFDGPPSHESGRFIEVENEGGASISFGEWVERDDGYWVLRIPDSTLLSAEVTKWQEMAEFWKRRADQRQIDINELKQNPALVCQGLTHV